MHPCEGFSLAGWMPSPAMCRMQHPTVESKAREETGGEGDQREATLAPSPAAVAINPMVSAPDPPAHLFLQHSASDSEAESEASEGSEDGSGRGFLLAAALPPETESCLFVGDEREFFVHALRAMDAHFLSALPTELRQLL